MTFQTTSEAMTTMMETFVDFFVQAEDFTGRISHSPGQCCDCYTAIGPTVHRYNVSQWEGKYRHRASAWRCQPDTMIYRDATVSQSIHSAVC